jgi:DNA-binding FrmR family transcriptional regulator
MTEGLASLDERAAAVRHAQRASGQIAALAGMIGGADPFPNVAQQLLAARGSLDSLLVRLVKLELGDCLPNQEIRDEVDSLLRTALGRSAAGRNATRTQRRHVTAMTQIPRLEERTTR